MIVAAGQVISRVKANRYYRKAAECPEYTAAVELRQQALKAQAALPVVKSPSMPDNTVDLNEWLAAVVATVDAKRADEAKRGGSPPSLPLAISASNLPFRSTRTGC